jgi:N-acyl-phosphatidylethanolamine-hydrolysing phospholipase D
MPRASIFVLFFCAIATFCALALSSEEACEHEVPREYSFNSRVKEVLRKRKFQGEFTYFDSKKGTFVNRDLKKRRVRIWKFLTSMLFPMMYHRDWPKYFHTQEGQVFNARESGLRAYFVNHATFLVQIEGINILTDPIWSKRASPFTFVGPKRVTNPGIKFDDLPKIDAVLISHDHYDHLDLPTLIELKRKFDPKFFVGLGVKELLVRYGITKVAEMAWGESRAMNVNMQVAFVPSQHHSGRGCFDLDSSLWGGFVVNGAKFSFYFLGDTGYNESMFQEVREKFPSLDLALIPIGAYENREILRRVHVNPEEAVLIHKILAPKKSIPMHYGTFKLSTEGYSAPLRDLESAMRKWNVSADEFAPIAFGQSVVFPAR